MDIKQKIYIKIIGAMLLVLLAGMFLFPVLLDRLERASSNFNGKKNNLEVLLDGELQLRILANDYSSVKDGAKILSDSFLTNDMVINLIKDIERIASATNNKEEIRILSSNLGEERKSLKFQISLYGDFQSLMKFLLMVENGKYQTRITRLSINKIFKDDFVGRLRDIPGIKSGDINTVLDIEAYTL